MSKNWLEKTLDYNYESLKDEYLDMVIAVNEKRKDDAIEIAIEIKYNWFYKILNKKSKRLINKLELE